MPVPVVDRHGEDVDAITESCAADLVPAGDDSAGGVGPGPGQHVLVVVGGARLEDGLTDVAELLIRTGVDRGCHVRMTRGVQTNQSPRRDQVGRAVTIHV